MRGARLLVPLLVEPVEHALQVLELLRLVVLLPILLGRWLGPHR